MSIGNASLSLYISDLSLEDQNRHDAEKDSTMTERVAWPADVHSVNSLVVTCDIRNFLHSGSHTV